MGANMGLSLEYWLILFVIAFMLLWPLGRILKRVGRSPWIAVFGVVPFAPIVMLWWIAYGRWPKDGPPAAGPMA
jgi:hypothetical protein